MRPAPLVWFGALREPSGYADEARSYLLALEDAGYEPVAREPTWCIGDAGLSGRQGEAVERAVARRAEGRYLVVQHMVPHPRIDNAKDIPTVARTMFETDSLPTSFKSRLIDVAEVWVPTEFNVDTFARGGIPESRLRVVPETLDFELFTPGTVEPWPIEGRRSFTFLTNFDFTDRKGWDVLLDAWAAAFGPDDDVSLVLKCISQHGFSAGAIRERVEHHLDGRLVAPILVLTDVLDIAAMPRLYAAADAFVMASRGEGWGRPYMEAMAMGLPTIGSRFSGNLAFMHDENSWLVDGRLVDVPDDAQSHTPLYRGHRWFGPDVEALAAAMREVASGSPDVRRRASSARAELLQRFEPALVGRQLVELAEDLLDRVAVRAGVTPGCTWRGDFGSGHSLAIVNDGIVDALEASGEAVERLVPESVPSSLETVGVAAHWPPSFMAPCAGPFVLYQPWEFGRVPEHWVEAIRLNVDEVWTPSEYSRRAYVESGVAADLVHVVPNGIDLDRFSPEGPAWPLPERGTVFLFVGGLVARKGVDLLLEAYGRAFTAADDVCLVLKGFGAGTFYRGQTSESLLERFHRLPDRPELVFLDEEVPYERLPSLYRAASVLVQPYRGEGFCLPALEALACGVPVIVTDGGPTDDFTSEACAWRVPSRRVPVEEQGFSGRGLTLAPGAFLLEPELDALVTALQAATDPEERARRAATARMHAEPFGWAGAAARVRARIAELADKTPVRTLDAADVPDRRGFLFHVPAEWRVPESWLPALHAYLETFTQADDVTLVFPADDVEQAAALVAAELERSGVDPDATADIALAQSGGLDGTALELAADATICSDRSAAPRARVVLPPTRAALRAAAPIAEEVF